MPANIESVRKLALSLPGVEEGICFGTPAFYVRRKLMVRLKADGETLVVRYPKDDRQALIDENPDVFSVTEHYRNYPAILVSLGAVSRRLLGAMIEGAWRLQAPRALISTFESDQAKTGGP